MNEIKKFLPAILVAVVLGVFIWLGFDGLEAAQELNEEITFLDNVKTNWEANTGLQVVAYTGLAGIVACLGGMIFKSLR